MIRLREEHSGQIAAVEGPAAEIGILPGDELLTVNDHPVRDVIDVQFYAAEPTVELLIRREGELWLYEVEREPGRPLGLTFEHPTFDIDIRRCNNRCSFCFVTQMAPSQYGLCAGGGERFRRSLYVKDDDYRYSFLDGNYVTLTNLSEEDWKRIAEQRLSPLYVSVHATEPALRRKILENPNAPDVMEQFRRLAGYGIEVHTQIVVVPEVNDGLHLERSVRDLGDLWPAIQTVSVVPVGLTRFHKGGLRTNTPTEASAVLDRVTDWQAGFLSKQEDRFVYASDEWYLLAGRPVPPLDHYRQLEALQENGVGLVSRFLADWEDCKSANQKSQIPNRESQRPMLETPVASLKRGRVALVTGTAFAPMLWVAAAEFAGLKGLNVVVRPVVNRTLGDTITVAGLLMGGDVIRELAHSDAGNLVVLPGVMFRGPEGLTLDGLSLGEIGERLGRPVVTAEGMCELANPQMSK